MHGDEIKIKIYVYMFNYLGFILPYFIFGILFFDIIKKE
jgi:hypothetical protein